MMARWLVALLCGIAVPAWADEFDLYTNSVLSKAPSSEAAALVEKITLSDLLRAPEILPGTNGAFLVVRTDEGNWCKLVAARALRKQGDSEQPIVVLHRYWTLRRDTDSGRLAAGRNVYLFDGFRMNLDIGQIVPDGEGGDIEFHRDGAEGGYLQATGKAKLYKLTKPLVETAVENTGFTPRGPVTAQDFAGRYRLVANGQWSGILTFQVTKSGELTGTYVSDQTGRDYPVKGFVATPSHRVRFTVELPMAKQEFDGYLWTRGKSALAGVTTLTDRPYGFVAIREGSELMPKIEE